MLQQITSTNNNKKHAEIQLLQPNGNFVQPTSNVRRSVKIINLYKSSFKYQQQHSKLKAMKIRFCNIGAQQPLHAWLVKISHGMLNDFNSFYFSSIYALTLRLRKLTIYRQ